MQRAEKNQVKALIDLINRETGPQAALLRGELARIMQENPSVLHDIIEKDFHSAVPASLVHAMEEACWDSLQKNVHLFAQKINPNLEEGLAIVTRFVNPAVALEEISQDLDTLARSLRPLLLNCNGTAEVLDIMSRFFFRVQGFTILPSTKDIKEVSFGRFLEKKSGSALCLSCLYALCAERFGLDGGVVDLAGRLLAVIFPTDGSEPVFVDPLAQGKQLLLQDCKEYIDSRNLQWSENFITPLSSHTLMRRFLGNMIFILNKLRDERRLAYLRRYMDILNNSYQ